jgi:regulatory protein
MRFRIIVYQGDDTMVVTSLEEVEKSKIKVVIDDIYTFYLYQKEVDNFGLKEGLELTEENLEKILLDTVYRRAKQKALSILKFMDRTEQELRNKLSDAGYMNDIIERTIAYVLEYGYLNNERYASTYIRARMNSKSRLAIRTELLNKGLPKELIDRSMQEEYETDENISEAEDAELIAIRKAVAKKFKGSEEDLSQEEKKKIMASLYRKGFDIGKIRQVIK